MYLTCQGSGESEGNREGTEAPGSGEGREEGSNTSTPSKSYPHGEYLLLIVERVARCKQSQLSDRPDVHLSTQRQLLLPQLQRHLEVIHGRVGLLSHLQNISWTFSLARDCRSGRSQRDVPSVNVQGRLQLCSYIQPVVHQCVGLGFERSLAAIR